MDANGSRWLLGDNSGTLFVLVLQNDGNRILDLKLERLGETSIASTVSYHFYYLLPSFFYLTFYLLLVIFYLLSKSLSRFINYYDI